MSKSIVIKPYKNKEIRSMYGMDLQPKAFKALMDKHKDAIGERSGQYYDVHQVLIIFAKLGVPNEYLPDELEKKNSDANKAA